MRIEQLETILQQRVRPKLALHGGDVECAGYEDGVLRVRLAGGCAGCPAAVQTMQALLEEEVRAAAPEVKRIVLIQGVSDQLLGQARSILAQRRPS